MKSLTQQDRSRAAAPRAAWLVLVMTSLCLTPAFAQDEEVERHVPTVEEAFPDNSRVDTPDYHPHQVRTMRGEIWDDAPEATGVLTSERSVLPAGISLGRAQRVERAQVDQDELADRQARMMAGERFTARIASVRAMANGDLDSESAAAAGARATSEPAATSSYAGAIFGVLAGLAGIGAFVWTCLRGR